MSNLGDFLKFVRNGRSLSQSKVYQSTGITDSRLCKAEKGVDNTLSPEELKKLASLYEISAISLFIKAGYIDESDMEEYRSGFRNIGLLDKEERQHIQDQIDFLIKKKG